VRRIATIDEVCELVTDGTHYTPKNAGTGVPFLTVKDVTDDALDLTNCSFITEQDFEAAKAGNSAPREGDVLFSKDGTVGKVHVVATSAPFAVLSSLAILRPKSGEVEPRYLGHALRSPSVLDDALKKKTGSAIRRIILGDLKKVRLALPPLAEQRRIAEVLDRAKALRAKRLAALAELDFLTQSLFLDLFGDPVTNPRKWPQQNLETFFYFRTGKLDSNAAVSSGQYPFFTCSREDFRIDSFAFDCEALLLAGNNASADYSVKHFKGKFNAYQRTYVITLRDERNSYDYSRFVLEHRLGELKRMSKGTGTKYLTLELLNRICVPVPPIALQQEFARRVGAVEKLKAAQRTALAEQDALFATLQHRAFRRSESRL